MIWQGKELLTYGDIMTAMFACNTQEGAQEFREAYRAVNEYADQNIGYLIGYVEPPDRRQQMYDLFQVDHPLFADVGRSKIEQ